MSGSGSKTAQGGGNIVQGSVMLPSLSEMGVKIIMSAFLKERGLFRPQKVSVFPQKGVHFYLKIRAKWESF